MDINVNTTATYPTLERIQIRTVQYVLDASAIFRVDYFNNQGTKIDTRDVDMVGTDFDNWGTADSYAVTFILTTLGLTETV